jgi:Leucine-rich repeat (LRR) protein
MLIVAACVGPLAFGIWHSYRKGFRFGLVDLLAAFVFFSILTFILLVPIVNLRNKRHAVIRLHKEGAYCGTERFDFRLPFERVARRPSATTAPRIPIWLRKTAPDLAALPCDEHVRSVRLFSDGQLTLCAPWIRQLPNLESVELYGPGITSDGIAALGDLGRPRNLAVTISNTSIDEDGLREIAEWRNVICLYLFECGISTGGLSELSRMGHLRQLSLVNQRGGSYHQLRPEELVLFSRLQPLEHLSISGNQIPNEALWFLRKLNRLRSVGLNQTGLTDEGLAHLCQVSGIEYLWLREPAITDKGIEHFVSLPDLKTLVLREVRISEAALASLGTLAHLERLQLEGCNIAEAALLHLSDLEALRELSLRDTNVTDDAVDRLQSVLPQCAIDAPIR